jgi:hypothetical protein
VLLTAASWVLQRLPGQGARVLERQRAELIRTLRQSQDLIVIDPVRLGAAAGR